MMKRVALLLFLAGWFVPLAPAQDHIEAGAFADYFHLSQTHTNFAGLGARLGVSAYSHVKFEGEMSYDFDQAFTEGFTDTGTGILTIQRSGMRILHGEFGPKVELGHSALHPFVTLKGGFVNFRINNAPATFSTFVSSVDSLRRSNVDAVLYPGAGLEGHLGPLGMRLDVGDEMYFNHGTHHNLRVAFGPVIRF
jgi:hypothetical protein